jgi:hypothetical protein
LRELFGNFRFLDTIALASARHHSLEVTGRVEPQKFWLTDKNVIEFLHQLFLKEFSEIEDKNNLKKIFDLGIEEANKGTIIDEPPSPSDDFYFIYTLTNRVVKFADWEDAGDCLIELPLRR